MPGLIAERALDYIKDGQVVGLGTGKAAKAFIEALGARIKEGTLKEIRGIPTSNASADLARQLRIELTTLDAELERQGGRPDVIDVAVDGADAVELGTLNLLKGLGGAAIREKVVETSARMFVVVVTERAKLCSGKLGSGPPKNILPVEVVPFARPFCYHRLAALPGCRPSPRTKDGKPWDGDEKALYITDNGNPILDCQMDPIDDPEGLDRTILAIPGVVGTGLFLGMASLVLAPNPREDGVEVLQRTAR